MAREFGRFLIAGGSGFLATLAVTFVLTEYVGWWYFASFVVSQVAGWTLIFALNTFFTFSESYRGDLLARFGAFLLTYLGAFIVNALIVLVFTEGFGVHYLFSMVIGVAAVVGINFFISKHVIFSQKDTHPFIKNATILIREHWMGLVLAFVVAVITIVPHFMLWNDPQFRGIEMMMLDAEEHYMARVHEIGEGYIVAGNTFLPDKDKPYATPPLGEAIIALFGKTFGMEAARASIVSKPISMAVITILIYALAFSLSRSRLVALIGTAVTVFGYNLIGTSPGPFIELLRGSPGGGPFFVYSRLVNPSLSAILFFGGLLVLYRAFFMDHVARTSHIVLLGGLIGASIYMSPYPYVFLGALLICTLVWFLFRKEREKARAIFFAGTLALVVSVPFVINYLALNALPDYETVSRFLGVVERREFVLGALLPLLALCAAFIWPRLLPKEGRTFFLLACAALFLAMNHQTLTGLYLQPGHYHWYITKPLAGLCVGLLIGALIMRIPYERLRVAIASVILIFLFSNSLGFLAPWYQKTHADALALQAYAPLMEHLNTISPSTSVWASIETSAFIPIYTDHDAPNNLNTGSYPNPPSFFENRLFLEYRLRGVRPAEFEKIIREEAHYVGDRLWGLWLRELTGDSAAIPEEEFERLSNLYTEFFALSWNDALDTLGITIVSARSEEEPMYRNIPVLRERARVSDFVVFERF
ncbi:GtrA family protein [Candidatus Parcubacteria bacterium]|nr:MAG: GtrA family protein [Candidatus Parcubacteria bacterium]